MHHILPIIVVAALLLASLVIAAGAKMSAAGSHSYTARSVTGLSVALPTGMKTFPVELPE